MNRRAFTIIEMLVVITIIVTLTGMGLYVIGPISARRVREAARLVSGYFNVARSQAMETGKPCGVVFTTPMNATYAMVLDQCSVPATYSGDAVESSARITWSDNQGTPTGTGAVAFYSDASGTVAESMPTSNVGANDRIQFNYQGPMYTVFSVAGTSGVVEFDAGERHKIQAVPWTTATSRPLPYKVFRSPTNSTVRSVVAPLQMPTSSVVDLQFSGIEDSSGTLQPLSATTMVLFSPTGAVDSVYVNGVKSTPSSPLFFLVGKRERSPFVAANYNASDKATWSNEQDMENFYVVVNWSDGMVSVSEVGTASDPRWFARQQSSVGGH